MSKFARLLASSHPRASMHLPCAAYYQRHMALADVPGLPSPNTACSPPNSLHGSPSRKTQSGRAVTVYADAKTARWDGLGEVERFPTSTVVCMCVFKFPLSLGS